MKDFFEDVLWNIKAFIAQPIIFTESMDFVKEHNGSLIGTNDKKTYAYYWIGDFKNGYKVKVKLTYFMGYNKGFEEGVAYVRRNF